MNRTTLFFLVSLVFVPAMSLHAQTVPVIKFNELSTMLAHDTDTTMVYNFFATWCDPCKKEFPAFQQFAATHANRKVKLVFISLDFKKKLSRSLMPYLKSLHVNNDVYLLDEPDYNAWINKIDSSWGGDLPMTLVVNTKTGLRKTYAQEFSYQALQSTLIPFIQ